MPRRTRLPKIEILETPSASPTDSQSVVMQMVQILQPRREEIISMLVDAIYRNQIQIEMQKKTENAGNSS